MTKNQKDKNMDLELVSRVFETLRITPPSKLTLLEAQTLSSAHVPPFPPDMHPPARPGGKGVKGVGFICGLGGEF